MENKQYQEELLENFKENIDQIVESCQECPLKFRKEMVNRSLEKNFNFLENELKSSQERAKKNGGDYDYSKTLSEAKNYIKNKLEKLYKK